MALLGGILEQLLHLALLLAAAPLVLGITRWLQARMLGRRGAPVLQPFRDLDRLLRKQPVLAENASWISEAAPYAGLAACLAAAALVPSFTGGMLLAPTADLLVVAGLLAAARMALLLAGMDAGTALGGMGAARGLAVSVLAEPALLACAISFSILAGTTNLDGIAAAFREGAPGLRVPLALVGMAMLMLALTGNARNRTGLAEPAMADNAMLLESSGRHLALWEYQSALRLTLWLALLAALFLPFGMAPAGAGPLLWLVGLLAWAVKMGGLCLVLAIFESASARTRLFRLPEFLGLALLLALLAAALLFLGTGLA
ncbi:MAG: NADH-quinone oxidoreductase subunit H [Acetobacteraceae bacterium]|nr:NADH-quinone oxidoreductase subunit H [Acetobacteraceae bacterium]